VSRSSAFIPTQRVNCISAHVHSPFSSLLYSHFPYSIVPRSVDTQKHDQLKAVRVHTTSRMKCQPSYQARHVNCIYYRIIAAAVSRQSRAVRYSREATLVLLTYHCITNKESLSKIFFHAYVHKSSHRFLDIIDFILGSTSAAMSSLAYFIIRIHHLRHCYLEIAPNQIKFHNWHLLHSRGYVINLGASLAPPQPCWYQCPQARQDWAIGCATLPG